MSRDVSSALYYLWHDVSGRSRQVRYILGDIPEWKYPNVCRSKEIEQVYPEFLVLHYLEDVRVCGADYPDVGVFRFQNMQYRLLVKSRQL